MKLPESIATAVYWLNVSGRSMVADQLVLWYEELRRNPRPRNESDFGSDIYPEDHGPAA